MNKVIIEIFLPDVDEFPNAVWIRCTGKDAETFEAQIRAFRQLFSFSSPEQMMGCWIGFTINNKDELKIAKRFINAVREQFKEFLI